MMKTDDKIDRMENWHLRNAQIQTVDSNALRSEEYSYRQSTSSV